MSTDKKLTPEEKFMHSVSDPNNLMGIISALQGYNLYHPVLTLLRKYGQQEETSGYERGLLAGRKENRYKATDQFYTGIDRGLEIAQLKEANEWVSVEERLPKKPGLRSYEHVDCWCFVPSNGVLKLAWNCEHECWDSEDYDDVSRHNSEVTHWMECRIPAPPKQGKENEDAHS